MRSKAIYHTAVRAALWLLLVALPVSTLGGCATPADNARSLLDRLEFEENEYGTFELEGTLDLNGNPFVSTNVHVKLEKTKPIPRESEPAPTE